MYFRNDDLLNDYDENQELMCCPMGCPFYQMYSGQYDSEEFMRQGPGFNPPPRPGFNPPPGPGFGGPGMQPGFGGPQGPGGPNIPPPPSHTPPRPTGGAQLFAVSPGSIRPCTNRFVYIWLRNGRSFWAYLTRVDRRSASGWRWNGRRWVYFGVDLNRIDEFSCF